VNYLYTCYDCGKIKDDTFIRPVFGLWSGRNTLKGESLGQISMSSPDKDLTYLCLDCIKSRN